MKAVVIAAALAFVALPALAQEPNLAGGTQQTEPGTGGTSKPGMKGDPGGKNGPAAKDAGELPSNNASSSGVGTGTAGSDNNKVPGMPGNKSGPDRDPQAVN